MDGNKAARIEEPKNVGKIFAWVRFRSWDSTIFENFIIARAAVVGRAAEPKEEQTVVTLLLFQWFRLSK